MKYLFIAFIPAFASFDAKAQSNAVGSGAIKAEIGVGYNDTNEETGLGLIYGIGYQKSFGAKSKLRVNPTFLSGEFTSAGINHVRDQFYRMSALQFIVAYDVIRFKSVSFFLSTGGSIIYSRGLFGIGGEPEFAENSSKYFYSVYFGVNGGLGLRINQSNSRFAYEIKPLNFSFGNKSFLLANSMVSVGFKFTKPQLSVNQDGGK